MFKEVPILNDLVMIMVRVRVFQRNLVSSRGFLKFLVSCKGS